MNKLNDIKIIFLDIDGTLTNSKKEISNYTKEIITKTKEMGIYVVLCTGRTNSYTIEKSKLTNSSNIVISNNGALIYDYEKDKVIFESPFPNDVIKKIYNFSIENQVDCTLNSIYNRYKSFETSDNDYITDATIIDSFDIIKENITQAVINSYDYEKTMKVKDYLQKEGNIIISNTNLYFKEKNSKKAWFMDINTSNNSKGKAINILLEYLNIKKEQTICFGDQMNDYPMFEACKYSVAMINGNNELKKKATFITEFTNDEDGVAHFIEKYII